jgi:2-succinyl-5-enolpyruvyl-6-hydroxy-3-cyclohexene-1-carboxylate synthase
VTNEELNLFWAQLVIEELRRQGIDYFVGCPGSRSSPMAIAIALEERISKIIHHDERGAAYHAIGYTRATGRPAAILSTSGTAAANFFPAVVEAAMDHLPLIVLTADRPPELRDCGANQTIDQARLFGNYARYFVDLPCPGDDIDPSYLLSEVDRAFAAATNKASGPGPAHLNCMYREPLVPTPAKSGPLDTIGLLGYPSMADWAGSDSPQTAYPSAATQPAGSTMKAIADHIGDTEGGLLLIGRLDRLDERQEALHLAKALGWPTIVDITSGIGLTSEPFLIHHHDLLLTSESVLEELSAGTIVHVGGRLVSKRLQQVIEATHPENYIFNNEDSQRIDPTHRVTHCLNFENAAFCSALATYLEKNRDRKPDPERWRTLSQTADQTIEREVENEPALTEPSLARIVSRHQSAATALFLASSMPIRDMDMFASTNSGIVPVGSNRGASGIDGTIASAAGYATGLGQPTTLVVGDLAFLHDLSSLPLAAASPVPLTIVIVNNNGGRIFEQLPVFEHTEIIEPFFVAPHDLTFDKVAATFGFDYHRADSSESFEAAYRTTVKAGKTSVIEAMIDPVKSREHRTQIIDAVKQAVDKT